MGRLCAMWPCILLCASLLTRAAEVTGEGLPPLSASAWWYDPEIQSLLDHANPLAQIPIAREPRYADPFGWQFLQDPFRLGFIKHDELVVLPETNVTAPGQGSQGVTEFYSWLRYSELVHPQVLMNLTGIFDGYYWSGPAQPHLPGQVDRLSLDLEAVLLGNGPVATAVGIHPKLVADLEHDLTRDAFIVDGHLFNTHRLSPEWLLVYGLAVWDRVDLVVIPEVGIVWMPDDRREFRLLFPRSQFSYRLGLIGGGQTWLTSTVEYVVQAYQVDLEHVGRKDRIQLQDWRATCGVRQDYQRLSWTADLGVVFDRQVTFRGPTPGYDLAPSALFRIGLWF